jgi:general secretion pathway protein A
LEGLGKDETELYIRSRMTKGGLNPALLTAEAIQQIFAYSEGIPRRVNNICTLVLLKAKMAGLPTADAALVKAVAESLEN